MKHIKVESVDSKYIVYIDEDISGIEYAFKENNIKASDKLFIITDNKVYNLYRNVIDYISNKYCCMVYCFNDGEENKNLRTVEGIYDFLIENHANRDSVLIAFGGGVVGDIVGYAAATFMRGMRFINIPTTLISQVDSCIGGKVGFNYKELKNIIGSFYNPIFVYINIQILKTLDDKDFVSGLGEVVKYGLIKENNLLELCERNYNDIWNKDYCMILDIISQCLKCKSEVIAEDFKDIGTRNILNFGHTIGHGLEVSSSYKLPHGTAVALGMLTAIKISEVKFNLPEEIYKRIANIYDKLGLISKYKIDNLDIFLYAINRDKKNDNEIRFVLLESLGKCKIKIAVTDKEIINAIKNSISRED